MRSGTRLERTHQRLLTPGFSKIERVFNPHMGTRGGPVSRGELHASK